MSDVKNIYDHQGDQCKNKIQIQKIQMLIKYKINKNT